MTVFTKQFPFRVHAPYGDDAPINRDRNVFPYYVCHFGVELKFESLRLFCALRYYDRLMREALKEDKRTKDRQKVYYKWYTERLKARERSSAERSNGGRSSGGGSSASGSGIGPSRSAGDGSAEGGRDQSTQNPDTELQEAVGGGSTISTMSTIGRRYLGGNENSENDISAGPRPLSPIAEESAEAAEGPTTSTSPPTADAQNNDPNSNPTTNQTQIQNRQTNLHSSDTVTTSNANANTNANTNATNTTTPSLPAQQPPSQQLPPPPPPPASLSSREWHDQSSPLYHCASILYLQHMELKLKQRKPGQSIWIARVLALLVFIDVLLQSMDGGKERFFGTYVLLQSMDGGKGKFLGKMMLAY
jgi:hypothetical protein